MTPLQPASPSEFEQGSKQLFKWNPNAELLPGQSYDLIFWPVGSDPANGRSRTAGGTSPQLYSDLPDPGSYRWGVWIGRISDSGFIRIRFLGEGGSITVKGPREEEREEHENGPKDPGDDSKG